MFSLSHGIQLDVLTLETFFISVFPGMGVTQTIQIQN